MNPGQAGNSERAVQETYDQYLTVAKERGSTKRRQVLQLLDNYENRNDPITWIRENGSAERGKYLDNITASPGLLTKLRAMMRNKTPGLGMTCALLDGDYQDGARSPRLLTGLSKSCQKSSADRPVLAFSSSIGGGYNDLHMKSPDAGGTS